MSLDRVQAACKRLFTKCMPPNRRQEDRNLFSPIDLESPGNDFQDPLIEQQQQVFTHIPPTNHQSANPSVKPKPQQPQRKPASKAGSSGNSPRATDQYAQFDEPTKQRLEADQAAIMARRAAAVVTMTRGWEQRSSALDVVPNAEEAYIKFIVQEKQDKQAAKASAAAPAEEEPSDAAEVSVKRNRIVGLGRAGDTISDAGTESTQELDLQADSLRESLL